MIRDFEICRALEREVRLYGGGNTTKYVEPCGGAFACLSKLYQASDTDEQSEIRMVQQ